MKVRFSLVTILSTLLSACSATVPASGITSDGISFAGTTTASLTESGKFSVTGTNGVTCSGTYDAFDTSKRFKAPVSCTDGRTGEIDVVRNNDGRGGIGDVTFSDGTTGNFVFGETK
jgi:hypothetical protein